MFSGARSVPVHIDVLFTSPVHFETLWEDRIVIEGVPSFGSLGPRSSMASVGEFATVRCELPKVAEAWRAPRSNFTTLDY